MAHSHHLVWEGRAKPQSLRDGPSSVAASADESGDSTVGTAGNEGDDTKGSTSRLQGQQHKRGYTNYRLDDGSAGAYMKWHPSKQLLILALCIWPGESRHECELGAFSCSMQHMGWMPTLTATCTPLCCRVTHARTGTASQVFALNCGCPYINQLCTIPRMHAYIEGLGCEDLPDRV